MEYILRTNALSKRYKSKWVLRDVCMNIQKGDIYGFVGENGSGKSTLVKCLLGIKAADSGKIIMGDGLKSTDIGYLPQHTNLQNGFPATVSEVVISGCLGRRGFLPFYSSKEKAIAQQAMERLGIAELASRSCRELSGGQQQRILLARAMCAAKKLLLLDEPVTGLDPAASAEMYELIAELNQKDKMTIIMVSHDVVKALDCASHILCLCSNDHSFFGTPEEYATSHISSKFIGD